MTLAIDMDEASLSIRDRLIVDRVTLTVNRGETVGLLGPNGAGKTTTLELIAGLQRPTAGRVTVHGVDPVVERSAITSTVGVQPQSAALFPTLTVNETLDLFASFHDDHVPLDDLTNRLGLAAVSDTRVKHLSGGEERRLLIGLALVGRPTLVLLDEPSAGLDPGIRLEIAELVREVQSAGATVLLTTHLLQEAQELCDRVVIMADGKVLLEGSPEMLAQEFAAPSEVSFTVPPRVDPEVLDTVVGERRVERRLPAGIRVTVASGDPDDVVRRVTFARGLSASGFSVTQPTLEDVYMRVVGEAEARSQ